MVKNDVSSVSSNDKSKWKKRNQNKQTNTFKTYFILKQASNL